MKNSINLLVIALSVSCLTAQNISTIAGTGVNGVTGNGGAAISAQVSDPYGITSDASGNTYFVDRTGSVVRKIDASGIITAFAGQSTPGFSGDGGPATSAQFNMPTDVVLDNSGTYLYIADAGNNRVRRVHVATGTITTIAGTGVAGSAGDGGPAVSAPLSGPTGLGMDASGNLYVTVTANAHAVRVINTSGIISKFAGTYGMSGTSGDGGAATSAKLYTPSDVACIGSTVYIADYGNNRIRRVVGGIITTYAGTGSLLGDGGAATSALLSMPIQIAVDATGNLYIADFGQNRIRRVSGSTGIISSIVGNGTGAYSGDGGLASAAQINAPAGVNIDNYGNLTISDNNNFRLRKICLVTPTMTVTGAGAICQGASISVSVAGASTYSWSSGPTTSVVTLTPASTSGYTITGTTGGCSSTASTTVTVKANPTINIAGNFTICQGASTTLSVAGASTYTWSTNSNTVNLLVSPATNTVYSVTGTSLGCTSSKSVAVTVNSLPVVTFPSFGFADTLCVNSTSQTLTGALPSGGVYSGAGVNAGVFTPNTLGTFTVSYSYTDAAGCSNSSNRAVNVVTCSTTGTNTNTGISEYSTIIIGLYPNPASSQITVDGYEISSISICNVVGANVLTATGSTADVSGLPSGVYYLQAITNKGVSRSAKFIKQ